MSDVDMEQPLQVDELASLKSRADLMGLKYHPAIGVDALKAKIQAALDGEEDETPAANSSIPRASNTAIEDTKAKVESQVERSRRLAREGRKLVRVQVTCMNPMKKEWQGEQFTFSNRNVGTINRFVPFEVEWHVEQVILDMMRERQYLSFTTRRVGPMQMEVKEHKLVREFAINVLEPLTAQELKELAQRQAMAAGTSEV